MATQGTVTAFYCKKEDWSMYIERLNHYFIANDVAEGKKLILLSACGATIYMYRLIRVDYHIQKESENFMISLVRYILSLIVQRFNFNSRV